MLCLYIHTRSRNLNFNCSVCKFGRQKLSSSVMCLCGATILVFSIVTVDHIFFARTKFSRISRGQLQSRKYCARERSKFGKYFLQPRSVGIARLRLWWDVSFNATCLSVAVKLLRIFLFECRQLAVLMANQNKNLYLQTSNNFRWKKLWSDCFVFLNNL